MHQKNFQEAIKKSYEFTLKCIGHDKASGDIWRDCLEWVKTWDVTMSDEAIAQTTMLTDLYQRAVQIPLDNVEQLWHEFDAYEKSMNNGQVQFPNDYQVVDIDSFSRLV